MKTRYIYILSAVLTICPRTVSAKILHTISPRNFAPGWTKKHIIEVLQDILLSA